MNINVLDDMNEKLRQARNRGVNSQQEKEGYLLMSNKMKKLVESMEEQKRQLRQIANIAEEVKNPELAEIFQIASQKMNQEIDYLEDAMRIARNIGMS